MFNMTTYKKKCEYTKLINILKNINIDKELIDKKLDKLSHCSHTLENELKFLLKEPETIELKSIVINNKSPSINYIINGNDDNIELLFKTKNSIFNLYLEMIHNPNKINRIQYNTPYQSDYIEIILKDPSKPIDESFVFGIDYEMKLHIKPMELIMVEEGIKLDLHDEDSINDKFSWDYIFNLICGINLNKRISDLNSKCMIDEDYENGLLCHYYDDNAYCDDTFVFRFNENYQIFNLVVECDTNTNAKSQLIFKPSGLNNINQHKEIFYSKLDAVTDISYRLNEVFTTIDEVKDICLFEILEDAGVNDDMAKSFFTNSITKNYNPASELINKLKEDILINIIKSVSTNDYIHEFLKGIYLLDDDHIIY